jgi:hypothetical protein
VSKNRFGTFRLNIVIEHPISPVSLFVAFFAAIGKLATNRQRSQSASIIRF